MKQKNFYIKIDYLLYFYLFFHCFQIVIADCENGCIIVDKKCTHKYSYIESCDSYCLPDLIANKCYNCSEISASDYYVISDKCEKTNCEGKKIIFNTKQCVDACSLSDRLYDMGTGYCITYEDCNKGNKKINNNQCDCEFLFSSTTDEPNRSFKHCYSNGEICGPEHTIYDMDTGECKASTEGCGEKLMKVEKRVMQSDITRCSNQCKSNEFKLNGFCLDKCPENKYLSTDELNENSCLDNCNDSDFIIDGNKCVPGCNDYKYDNKSCINSCPEPYYITETIRHGKFCSLKCKYTRYYKYIEERSCLTTCNSGFYKKVNTYNICIENNNNCYFKHGEEDYNNKECFSNCQESGMPYHIKVDSAQDQTQDQTQDQAQDQAQDQTQDQTQDQAQDHICYQDCNIDGHNFHIEGEYECLDKCPDNYYEEGGICYCPLYAIEEEGEGENKKTKKVCYKDEKDCKENGYNYKRGIECLKICSPYFEVEDDVSDPSTYLKKCFYSVDECKSNNYYYYNTYMLKCWNACPSNMFSNRIDSDGKPIEDISRSSCVVKCGKNYPKHTYGINICKEKCDNGEFYTLEEPNTCISECNETYPYIGENNECLKDCENKKFFFPLNSGKFKCVSKCSDYGKFYIDDNPKCYDSCKIENEIDYYYYNSDHKCLSNCLYDANEKYYYPKQDYPQPCRRTNENKYYYENKTIVDSCNPNFISARGSFLCVEHCGSQKIYEKYCTNECPTEAPYIKNNNECASNCETGQYVILFKNECINSCPAGYSINTTYKICYPNCKFGEKFNLDTGECVTSCPSDGYYEKTTIFGTQEIYVCRKSCTGTKKFVKDAYDKECVDKCPENNNFIKFNSNECVTKCQSSQFFIDTDNSGSYHIYQCLDSCPTDQGYFYVKDNSIIKKKCYKPCPTEFSYIVDSTEGKFICLSACPASHPFYKKAEGTKSCLEYNPCSDENKYYFEGECLTGGECKSSKKKLFVENKICVDECSEENKFKTKNGDIKICKNHCESQYFIDSENNCVDDCPEKENYINYINGDKICKAQCDNNQYYYASKEINGYTIYNCTQFCQNDINGYYLTVVNSKKCIKQCPESLYLSKNERKFYYNCIFSPDYKFTLSGECLSSCDKTNQFYYENEKICLNQCKNDDFAYASSDNNYIYICINNCGLLPTTDNYYIYTNSSTNAQNKFCVKQCPSDKQYLRDNTCEEHCPDSKKFFVKEFKHSEDDLQKKCYTDCPKEYPYYTIYNDDKGNKAYGCQNNCDEGYKVINFTDKNIDAILCIKDCPDKVSDYYSDYIDYKFKIMDNNNKTCYSFCPPGKPYYKFNHEEDNNCYEACPEETPFTEINKLECKSEEECDGDFIDYENKKCLPDDQKKCPTNKKYMSKYKIGTVIKYICLDNCIEKYGKYLSPYETCVNNCESDDLVSEYGLINDPKDLKCICRHLYIINDALKMECLQNSTSETKCKNLSSIYSIKMFNSKECVKTCNNSNILSASEDICYDKSHICNFNDLPDDKNTHLITKNNGQRKCECSFKFYYKEDEEYKGFQKKVCLDYDGLCPTGYEKFIPETKECIKNEDPCPNEFNCLFLGKFCLRDCPKNSTKNDSANYYQCTQPNEYWHETTPGSGNIECLDKCLDKYPVYAPSTNQCLTTCKGSIYPYFYENKCYNSCNNSELLNIENGFITKRESEYANFICECHNPWFYNDVHKKICADSMIEYSITDCNNFTNPNPNPIYDHLVRSTLQCVDKCPKEFNYTFNLDCFENCTEAAYYYHYVTYKENSYECACENLWFYEPNNKIQCLNPNVTECVVYDYEDKFFDKKYSDKKYLINETNECVNKCPIGLYSFNYVCYDKCPTYTQDNQNDHICKCNKYAGYWFEYEKYNLTYLQCAVEKCPANNNNSTYIRENLLQKENKCIITCRENEEFPFSLRKVCVKECPYFTHTNDEEDELNDTCLFYDLNDKDVDTLEKFKAATNIQTMELYKNSGKLGGFLFDKFNTTLQIYAIDRKDSLKDISFKSNLTYIDFGTCFEKIMKDKNISKNESILITKYDIKPEANINIGQDTSENYKEDKYLINPVEYELFSSLTNEKIDALVCEPYEILISYPLYLNKFDKYIDGVNHNEYRKRFDLGKELYHKDNEIDIFNYNNTIYTHFCKELEINGKDLVFEDRYKYLYPNNKLLCESNCTFNNTDFDLERVNCLCTYKNVFDFNRTEEEINDILNNPDFYLPTQSSTNAEIIKCLFNFTLKQAIIKNEMFYCCTIMTVAQIVLVLISSIVSIKSMINDIRHILNKVNIKNYFLKKNKFFKNNKLKNDNIISSTNRALNNPPKKNNKNEYDGTEKGDNNFNNINIEKDLDSMDSDDNKKSKINNEILLDKNKIYSSTNNKAEYIPPDYNFKFFKPSDKGVIKPVERSEIPFDINPDTKYLIEIRKGVDYADDYLYGPYLPNQNIIVVSNEKVNKKKNEKSNNNTLYLNNTNNKDKLNNTKVEKASKKRNIKLFDNFKDGNEKNFIEVKPMKSNLKTNNEKIDFNPETELKLNDEDSSFFGSIRREQIFLRVSYENYLGKKHNDIYSIFLAEIFDKIYFIKICLFLKKFDIFCVQLSLYIFYHILLISILCAFFTVKIIKKIWEQDNFPDINFYLLYGLIANVIVWIIYQMFLCLLDFHDRIKDMITLKYELIENQYTEEFDKDNIHDSNEGIYKEKYDELIFQIKYRISMFYVIVFIFSFFFFIYLVSFFSFYTCTKHRVLQAYYISIIEIFLIKIVYGILLATLRYISQIKRIKSIYNFTLMLDKYLS